MCWVTIVDPICQFHSFVLLVIKQRVTLTGRNMAGPPCSVGHATARARRQCYRRRRQTTTTDAYRRQRAKQCWPIRRASNKMVDVKSLNIIDVTRKMFEGGGP